jgi:hypothetical protein
MNSTLSRNKAISEIGAIGEKIVFDLLAAEHEVFMSEDKFDSVKDMLADSKTVEVKTLVPIKIFDSFCIGSNQIVKCMNADRLFFVEIGKGNGIHVYESLKPRLPQRREYNSDTCYFFKLTELKLYGIVQSKSAANRLRALSPSKYL